MLNWIAIVLGLQLVGELVATLSGLPIPGPVLGMVALLALLLKLGRLPAELDQLASALLRHLYLYYLPATVGVTAHIGLVTTELVPILVSVVVSSTLAMVVAGHVVQHMTGEGATDAV
ncbi:MAG: CidA/LrgA family protein [Ectothiorhodospiraceae bacterium]|nr:CidA/LrgA family protein [Ectothiorhodospiraceae bacterium]